MERAQNHRTKIRQSQTQTQEAASRTRFFFNPSPFCTFNINTTFPPTVKSIIAACMQQGRKEKKTLRRQLLFIYPVFKMYVECIKISCHQPVYNLTSEPQFPDLYVRDNNGISPHRAKRVNAYKVIRRVPDHSAIR